MSTYYNEWEPYAADWLRTLIAQGLIPAGDVDDRSIEHVHPDDLRGYTQVHLFAGIGGWPRAARLAGWPDERPLWTASCPCQPFSLAGLMRGDGDERHLWPIVSNLIAERRPPVVMGEQVAAAAGFDWLDGVCDDLERQGYATGAAIVPALAVDAPHRRDRLWFVADADSSVCDGRANVALGSAEGRAAARWLGEGHRDFTLGDADSAGPQGPGVGGRREDERTAWTAGVEWARTPNDGKFRRVKSGVRLLANGVPNRVGRLRAYGNGIVPQVGAEVIGAYMDACNAA